MNKKRVAILYSGQIRSNSLNDNYTTDTIILDSTKEFFLNETFNEKYDYDVFFSVDNMNIEKAKIFFGEHLKNIHITEVNYCMNPIQYPLTDYPEIYNKYMETDFKGCVTHSHAVYQYYRLYSAYKLAKDYENKHNITYDYYVRIRPDIRLMQDINPLFHIIETTSKEIIMEHEQLCIISKNYEHFFHFIYYYGFFTTPVDLYGSIFKHYTKGGCMDCDNNTRFCPERQIIEYVYMIIAEKNQRFHDVFLGITYPSFNLLYRGDGLYGYVSYEEYREKYPYNKIDDILKNCNLLQPVDSVNS
jgi:hypothetical protein